MDDKSGVCKYPPCLWTHRHKYFARSPSFVYMYVAHLHWIHRPFGHVTLHDTSYIRVLHLIMLIN